MRFPNRITSRRRAGAEGEDDTYSGKPAFTLLGLCGYIFALATTLTHKMLLLGHAFTLPPLGAEVSLELFFTIAPLVLVVVHFYVLQGDRLGVNIHAWPVILALVRWSVYAAAPLITMLFIQGQFLAYHSSLTTGIQQALASLDFVLIFIFRNKISSGRKAPPLRVSWLGLDDGTLGFARGGWTLLLWVSIAFAVFFFSWQVSAIPSDGTSTDTRIQSRLWNFDWPKRNLSLRGEDLIGREAPAELLAVYAEREGVSIDEAMQALAQGVSLSGRDLRGADFTGAVLINADFRGADLRRASFVGADLRGAKFMPAGAADNRFESLEGIARRLSIASARNNPRLFHATRLGMANFKEARLTGANLALVNAASTRWDRADLTGAELSYANLRGAYLRKAKLAGANLWHAHLQRADLANADLRAADLSFTELEGAVLEQAFLAAADLSNSRLGGAWFAGADLRGAQFRDAQAIGASFRGANLQGARGLAYRGIILRQAKLDAFCPDPKQPPQLVDFREVEFPSPGQNRLPWSPSILKGVPKGPQREAALNRLLTQPVYASCSTRTLPSNLSHLGLYYHDERRPELLKDWPIVEQQAIQADTAWTEETFYSELTALWIEESCHSENSVRALKWIAKGARSAPPILVERELLTALRRNMRQRIQQVRQDGTSVAGRSCPALLKVLQSG